MSSRPSSAKSGGSAVSGMEDEIDIEEVEDDFFQHDKEYVPTPSDLMLLESVKDGDLYNVSILVGEYSANVNTYNSTGTSPCHIAAKEGYISILEFLFSCGADANRKLKPEFGGYTPLHFAVEKADLKVIDILLSNMANPNLQDSQGFTPLHIASRRGFTQVTSMLICRGSNPEMKDFSGKTAAYWANEFKQTSVLPLLPAYKYNPLEIIKEQQKRFIIVEVPKPKEKGKKKKKKGGGKKKKKK